MFKNEKAESQTVEFPLVFDAVQVSDDQWISKINVKDLMLFRIKQFISYNANTQRQLRKTIRGKGGEVFYSIYVNKGAVKSIRKELEQHKFIPNTLTFNMAQDGETVFEYDEKKKQLIIYKLSYFDIVDGYHRYLAACEVYDKNPAFDYTFEMRIINFPEWKARDFIFQEDQKTKMRRTVSKMYDSSNFANRIISSVNSNPKCLLSGMLTVNSPFCNIDIAAQVINILFFEKKNMTTAEINMSIMKVSNSLIQFINEVLAEEPNIIDKALSNSEIVVAMVVFYLYYNNRTKNITIENLLGTIRNVSNDPKIQSKADANILGKSAIVSIVQHIENLI